MIACYNILMKTNIYIDAANILISAKNINFDIDLNNLFTYLKDKYPNCKIIFFIGDVKALEEIRNILDKNEIEICIKEVAKEGGRLKANCDVELANRITIDVERNEVDLVVIMTGDGDFACLFDYAINMNKKVKCIATTYKNTSIFLRRRSFLKITFLEQLDFLRKENSLDKDLPS